MFSTLATAPIPTVGPRRFSRFVSGIFSRAIVTGALLAMSFVAPGIAVAASLPIITTDSASLAVTEVFRRNLALG
jgi:hypothetical protein